MADRHCSVHTPFTERERTGNEPDLRCAAVTMLDDAPSPATAQLSPQDRVVLDVLVATAGRVVSRQELARRTGLTDRSERRCDAILVQLRKVLGADAIRTVRSRGWMLTPTGVDRASTLMTA
jgi:DNA-binding response OmpR family regulator